MLDKIVTGITGKFAAPLLVKALLVALPLLLASVALNLHQFGKSYAADAECRAAQAEAVLKAIESHKSAQAEAQREIDEAAQTASAQAGETLESIAGGYEAAVEALRRQYAQDLTRRPVAGCGPFRLSAGRLRAVNAQLDRPRPD